MKIINCQTLSELCEFLLDGEPCFVFRAQDKVSVPGLEAYAALIHNAQAKNQIRTHEDIKRFVDWQSANPKRVKVPD